MLSYLSYLSVQDKKNLQRGWGWGQAKTVNLLDITLEYPSK